MIKNILFLIFPLILLSPWLMAQQGKIVITNGERIGTTRELRGFVPERGKKNTIVRDNKGLLWNRGKRKTPVISNDPKAVYLNEDPLRNRSLRRPSQTLGENKTLSPEFITNREGIGSTGITPADPTLCVGPDNIIQMVNGPSGAYFQVYDKSGNAITDAIYLDNLVDGAGYSGAGDGICLYDQYADRFVMTEFGTPDGSTDINTIVMFVSATNNPLGSWYIYKFTDPGYFPDYPKFSVWTDAWFATSRDFTLPDNNFAGISFYAFNKSQMIAGEPNVQLQRVRLTDAEKYDGAAPINAFGPSAPTQGSPGLFTFRNDDGRTIAADADSVVLLAFDVDFQNPSNSNFYTLSSHLTAPFNTTLCNEGGYFQACVTTPGNNSKLMATTSFVMDKPIWRKYDSHESILVYHTVNAGGAGIAGIRWHELRRTSGDWQLFQEGTYSPDDTHRFYPSMNMNAFGQIMSVYNSSSSTIWPSITVTGRNANDQPGSLPADETMVVNGTGYGTFSSRWGDYNMIAPDPVNDSIFWLTSMYGDPGGWRTKVASVKLAANKDLDAKLYTILSPLNGEVFCDAADLVSRIRIGNSGNTTLTSARINWQINNGSIQMINWNGSLAYGESEEITLPITITGTGPFIIKIFITNPNNSIDQRNSNDTLSVNITVRQPATGSFFQGFEDPVFPPNGWTVLNPNAGSVTWTRTLNASRTGIASAYMNLFNYNAIGDEDYLVSPGISLINTDSVFISFSHAYKAYSGSSSFADTLKLMASLDCGNSFTNVLWKEGGTGLASTAGFTGDINWVPGDNEWADNSIRLPVSYFGGAENVSFAWVSVNKFGQNIYLDDINVQAYTLPQLDISINKLISPLPNECRGNFEPLIEIRNNGLQTVESFMVSLQWNDGEILSRLIEGININTGQLYLLDYDSLFNATNLGSNLFRVWVSKPNGSDDQQPLNDTLTQEVFLFRIEQPPLQESFEQNSFPPVNWNVTNPDSGIGWQLSTEAATNGSRSALIRNYINPVPGDVDELYSSPINFANPDSVFLRFDVAHIASRTEGDPTDTLEIFVTRNCGLPLQLVYKKWGTELQTAKDPNFPGTVEFKPTQKAHWRTDSVDLTGIVQENDIIQVIFRNTSNRNNNLYLDDIRLYAVTLPTKLKEQGWLVTPNPTTGNIQIRHYLDLENLKKIEVINMVGQRVWATSYNGNASSLVYADISRQPAGIYIVRLIYNNKVRTTRIIKTNR